MARTAVAHVPARKSGISQNKRIKSVKRINKREAYQSNYLVRTICLSIVLIGVSAFCNLFLNVIFIQNSLKIEKISNKVSTQKNISVNLENKLSDLRNPQRIQKLAKRIGMNEANRAGYIVLETEKKIAKKNKSSSVAHKESSIISFIVDGWSSK